MTAPEIIFNDVSKFYGEVLGVNHVSLKIPSGITSLVGPNGSGKTTIMNLMAGLIHPDRGSISVRGFSSQDPEKLMRITGYATQYDTAPRGITGFDYVSFGLIISGYTKKQSDEMTWNALEQVNLTDVAHRKVASYSKGMRQRIRLAQAVAGSPDVLVLDEPLNGLDPLVRAETVALFNEFAARGSHVIISSHVLQEVDVISDQVIFIANGMIVAEGDVSGVREEIDEHPSQFMLRCSDASKVASLLFVQDHVTEIKLHDDRKGLLVMTRDRAEFTRVLTKISLEGHTIESVVAADANVDALYKYLIGGSE